VLGLRSRFSSLASRLNCHLTLLSRTESEKGCKMYEPFFGMERRPFSATPDPGCFFISSELQAVLDELTICVERGQGIGIVTASAGVGKTLLCQRLAADLRHRDESHSRFECVYLSNSNFPTRRSLLQAILFEMGDEYSRRDEPELRLDLRSRLRSLRPEREALVLIVDEAHLFSEELLEELRTMADIADSGSSLVRVILSGQHELEERLTDRAFDALNQRISNHVFLESLTISESVEYIRHRLAWAGCDIESVFSEEAISVITRASGGVPRCLNQLSDHSLLLAFASDEKPVSESTVREALEDLKQLPLHWNDVSDGTAIVGFVEEDDLSSDSDVAFELADDSDERAASSAETTNNSDEFTSSEADLATDDQSGIVESVTAATQVSSEAMREPASSPLDGGIEFDFSHESTGESTAGNETIDAAGSESETPETAVFEFSAEQSAEDVSDETDECDESELTGDDTQIQVINSLPQETLLESTSESGSVVDDELQNGERSDVCDVDSGICFQITSNGFEIDGFESPKELSVEHTDGDGNNALERDANDDVVVSSAGDLTAADDLSGSTEFDPARGNPEGEAVDSGVIELTFQDESAPTDEDSSVGLVEDQQDLEGEISAETERPDAEAEPVVDSDAAKDRTISAAEITSKLLGQDSILISPEPDHEASESDIVLGFIESAKSERTGSDSVAGETETTAEVFEPVGELSEPADEEPIVNNESPNGESRYEEELVFDPYAALQESESAGIVWDDSHGDTQSTEFSPAFSIAQEENAVEETADQTQSSFELDATEVPTAEALEEVESESVELESVELESATQDPVELEALELESVVERADFEQQELDIVQPVEVQMSRPDRLVDSVLPLLNELDEDLDYVGSADLASRSVLDIEAELIQAIEHDGGDLEDEIGATMLDIYLDTQSALQESAAALRNAEEAAEPAVDTDPKDLDDILEELPTEPFDIVQPEPKRRQEGPSYQLDPHFLESTAESSQLEATSAQQPQPVQKPFGRLFSDLRRRTS
jgi:type II secretory pathway predicted ATPase ExeA